MLNLLKLLDKMSKYEMGPARIVEDTARKRFCPQTDKVKPVYPLSTLLKQGYNKVMLYISLHHSETKRDHIKATKHIIYFFFSEDYS